ncbi:MAG: hypothetical protein ACYC6L_16810, partial [Anaerolineae bacterium]
VLYEVFSAMPGGAEELQRQLIVGSSGMRVDTVLIGGKVVYRHGQYQTVDAEQIVAHAQEVAHNLWNKL